MDDPNKTSIFRLSLTLLIITAVIAAGLAGVNAITKDRIADAAAQRTRAAIAEVLGQAEGFEQIPFSDRTGLVQAVYQAGAGWAVEVAATGFNGQITMMVGISRDGQVLGISIISHTETAGLGAVAGADSAKGQAFREQFIGESSTLTVSKDGGTVDAITGATITSRAVAEGVSAALECVELLRKGG